MISKLTIKKIEDMKIPSDVVGCQLMILALTDSLERTAQGEMAADKEVQRLQVKVENLEIELIRTDDRWVDKLREQAREFYSRTEMLQKQNKYLLEAMAALPVQIGPHVVLKGDERLGSFVSPDRFVIRTCGCKKYEDALHQISLGSQNSMTSMADLGKIARAALGESDEKM